MSDQNRLSDVLLKFRFVSVSRSEDETGGAEKIHLADGNTLPVYLYQEAKVRTVLLLRFFQADQICYSVLCVFSYVAAGQKQRRPASVSSSSAASPALRTASSRIMRN